MNLKISEGTQVCAQVYSPSDSGTDGMNLLVLFYLLQEKLSGNREKSSILNRENSQSSSFADGITKYLSGFDVDHISDAMAYVIKYFEKEKLNGVELSKIGDLKVTQKHVEELVAKINANKAEIVRLGNEIVRVGNDIVDTQRAIVGLIVGIAACVAAAGETLGISLIAAAAMEVELGIKYQKLSDLKNELINDQNALDYQKVDLQNNMDALSKEIVRFATSTDEEAKLLQSAYDRDENTTATFFSNIAKI